MYMNDADWSINLIIIDVIVSTAAAIAFVFVIFLFYEKWQSHSIQNTFRTKCCNSIDLHIDLILKLKNKKLQNLADFYKHT